MSHKTEHARFQLDQLTLTPVKVRLKSYSKTDRQTNTQIVQNHFLDVLKVVRYTSQIRSHLKVDFLHDANTSMGHGSNSWQSCASTPSPEPRLQELAQPAASPGRSDVGSSKFAEFDIKSRSPINDYDDPGM